MLNKIKEKMISIILSIIAFALMLPYILENYFSVSKDNDEINERNKYLITVLQQSVECKYGGPPVPFDHDALCILRIEGAVRASDSGVPLSGIEISLKNTNYKALSNKSGKFYFDLYYSNLNVAERYEIGKKMEFEAIDLSNKKSKNVIVGKNEILKDKADDNNRIYIDKASVEILL